MRPSPLFGPLHFQLARASAKLLTSLKMARNFRRNIIRASGALVLLVDTWWGIHVDSELGVTAHWGGATGGLLEEAVNVVLWRLNLLQE